MSQEGNPFPVPGLRPGPGRGDPQAELAADLHERGVRVWFETDLVAAWREGPTVFRRTMNRLATLAHVPGVVGFKVADELGYQDGLDTPAQAMRFLAASRAALQHAAPGTRLLVDAVVPELGSLSWTGEQQQLRGRQLRALHPAASLTAVTSYLRAGFVDVLSLSTGLLDPDTYREWGTSRNIAQLEAWSHVEAMGWNGMTRVQSRKALAKPGGYNGNEDEAEADVCTYVALPRLGGARGVDLWAWRQPCKGRTVSLLPPSLLVTPLWAELGRQRRQGARLLTHITPDTLPTDPEARAAEIDTVAAMFSSVFVSAGPA